jgi:hypothetical protein
MPTPGSHQLLVRVSHVAQNSTRCTEPNWWYLGRKKDKQAIYANKSDKLKVQSLDTNAFDDGAVTGCDFVGTVESIGNDVSRIAKGDIVSGLIWGGA